MHQAPRYDPLEESTVFPKGMSAMQLVEGTVPRGHLNDDTLLYTGKVDGKLADGVSVQHREGRSRSRRAALRHLLRAVPWPDR